MKCVKCMEEEEKEKTADQDSVYIVEQAETIQNGNAVCYIHVEL